MLVRPIQKFLRKLGQPLVTFFSRLGELSLFVARSVYNCFTPPFYLNNIWRQLVDIGFYSLPVVALTTIFAGMVIALQSYSGFSRFGAESAVASVVLISVTRELAPALSALMVAGRIGAAMAAEIGTMRVTQQIDALEIMGVNSANYLILPKVLGMMTMMPFLVCFSIFSGFVGAYATSVIGQVITIDDLTLGLQHDFNEWYVWMGFIKSIFFAFVITSVSAFYGYTVEGGSVEVGKASTDSVVSSSVLILFSDVLLTQLLS